VLVPSSGAATAREVLLQAEVISPTAERGGRAVAPVRLMAGLLVALFVGAFVVWLLSTVIH
jgi:hypothetical protein